MNVSKKIWRPFTQMALDQQIYNVSKASGAHLFLDNGQKVLDGISSWWVTNHGHCEPSIVAAISEQSSKVDQVLFANFSHDIAEKLVEALSFHLDPTLARFFFSDNGSTSVEVALKMSLQFWQQSGNSEKNKFLSFKNSYHGDTVGAMSLTGPSVFTDPYKKLLFPVIHAEQAYYSENSIDDYCSSAMEILESESQNLAAVILEPLVQGAGGMTVWPREAVQKIVQCAKKNNVLVIFDEVMTGFGRTGKLFAYEHLNYTPDILCLSKGITGGLLPLGLTVANDIIFEAFLAQAKEKMFFHGHSFTGNAISTAAALASLNLFRERDYAKTWDEISSIHQESIQKIKHHSKVKDVRHMGTIAAVELKDDSGAGYTSSFTHDFMQFSMQRNVFLRPLGNVIYILPPYCITKSELKSVWAVIEEYIEQK